MNCNKSSEIFKSRRNGIGTIIIDIYDHDRDCDPGSDTDKEFLLQGKQDNYRLIIVSIHLCGGSKARRRPLPKIMHPCRLLSWKLQGCMGLSGRAALE
jgi:hypothetical protein